MSDDAIAAGRAPSCGRHNKECVLRKSRKPGDEFGRSFWVSHTHITSPPCQSIRMNGVIVGIAHVCAKVCPADGCDFKQFVDDATKKAKTSIDDSQSSQVSSVGGSGSQNGSL
jgi:hypothetical protein